MLLRALVPQSVIQKVQAEEGGSIGRGGLWSAEMSQEGCRLQAAGVGLCMQVHENCASGQKGQ